MPTQRRLGHKPRTPADPLDDDSAEGDRGGARLTAMAAAKPTGVVGSYVGLCLLIRFPDVPAEVSRAEVTQYCNAPGYTGFGNYGSVHDYFDSVSGGRLDYTNIVSKYVTAKHPRAYYTDPRVEFTTRAQEPASRCCRGRTAVTVAAQPASFFSIAAVRRCQRAHGFGDDPPKKSFVGKRQAAHLGLLV